MQTRKKSSSGFRSGDRGGQTMGPPWQSHVSGSCCSTNYAPGVKRREGPRCTEPTCPHEHYGVHSPIKKEVGIQGNQRSGFHPNDSLYRVVQSRNRLRSWPHTTTLNIWWKKKRQIAWGFSSVHPCRLRTLFYSIPCECCFMQYTIHSTTTQLHIQFCVEAVYRTGVEDYSPLVVTLVQVVHENDRTASHAAHCERGVSYATRRVPVDRLACTASDTSSTFCTLRVCRGQRVLLALCTCFPQTAVYRCKHTSAVRLPLTLVSLEPGLLNTSVKNLYTKCLSQHSV
jgi:hypothetical protein